MRIDAAGRLAEHRTYLADATRLAAFRRAIDAVVRPGDRVLDLGAGTGILGLLACASGAGRVYAVESTDLIELARKIARANGFSDRIVHVQALSTRAELPEKVDVVVCDQIGWFGVDAGLLEYLVDARRRLLEPTGRLVPRRLDLAVAPVESRRLRAALDFWAESPAGFDFASIREVAANTVHPTRFAATELLAEPTILERLDLSRATTEPLRATASAVATRTGRLHGIGGWFSADLGAGVTVTNSPLARDAIDRRQAFFPLERPVEVAAGETVAIEMRIDPGAELMTWAAEVRRNDGTTESSGRHSTFQSLIISRETLRRTHPESVPELGRRGAARRTVLELCDGTRKLGELEREVFRRHPDAFSTFDEAAAFAAAVLARDAR